jgi:peptidoglycan hydrolase-like protein with peptidoglycan-binding domain
MTSKPMLKYGSTGSAVVELQHRLNAVRGPTGAALTPDGVFGPMTLAAVKAFQTKGTPVLVADGIVGPLTWGKLIVATLEETAAIASLIIAVAGSAPSPLGHLIAGAMIGLANSGGAA